jgi:predicted SAM-dependent methyltransferase
LSIKTTVTSSLKGSFPVGLYAALKLLRTELIAYRAHRAGVKKARAYAKKTDLKLNVGCGPNLKEGWVNIDLYHQNVDLSLDMRERIPLPDNSAQIIYSEHFFDYLEYPEVAKGFLNECLRVLQPRGLFRVGVADTRWPLLDYADVGDGEYFRSAETNWTHPEWCKTRMDHLNYHFRHGKIRHYAYDFETLGNVLNEAGFVAINQCEFDPGLDTRSRALGTLYVEAIKPLFEGSTCSRHR